MAYSQARELGFDCIRPPRLPQLDDDAAAVILQEALVSGRELGGPAEFLGAFSLGFAVAGTHDG